MNNEANTQYKLSYTIVRSKRKTLTMQITTDGLIIKSPLNLSDKFIEDWVLSKKSWIEKTADIVQSRHQHKKSYEQICEYKIGKQIPYMGGLINLKSNLTNLDVNKKNNIQNKQIFDGQSLYINPDKNIQRQVETWYKSEAQNAYIKLLDYWKIKMNLSFNSFKLGHGKKRLGFCTSAKEICISWYLIMQPLYVIEYVIVHELAHLVHFNHSQLFWALVKYYYPNYIKAENYLKNRGLIFI